MAPKSCKPFEILFNQCYIRPDRLVWQHIAPNAANLFKSYLNNAVYQTGRFGNTLPQKLPTVFKEPTLIWSHAKVYLNRNWL